MNPEHEAGSTKPAVVTRNEMLDLFETIPEFYARVPEQPVWVWEPYIARGAITELDAKAKLGKSTLLAFVMRASVKGEPFMGMVVQRNQFVYLTEQGGTSFRALVDRAGLSDSSDIAVLFYARARRATVTWEEIVRLAARKAVDMGAGVLVVDTLPQWAGLKGDDENSSGAALEAMRPLQLAAEEYSLAIVVVRHDRRSGGEVGESGRGSTAFAGAVDIILQLKRPEGNTDPALRVLSCVSRWDSPPELTIQLTDNGYVALGSGRVTIYGRIRSEVQAILPKRKTEAIDVPTLVKQLGDGGSESTVRDVLANLEDDGIAICIGRGVKGDPRRYWAPPAQTCIALHHSDPHRDGVPWNECDPSFLGPSQSDIAQNRMTSPPPFR
jgi:hypothetical protein